MSTGISISSINRIKELAEEKKYAEALEILDTQNLDKSINPQFLRISGEIFRENKRYYDSRRILLKSHQMAPQGIRIIFELIQVYLELGYFTKAQKYYEQYMFYSTPDDLQRDYVEYVMKKAKGADVKELASILLPILERMPEDKWNFEAVLLYDKLGRKDRALEESQYILENFKDSIYVKRVIEYIDDKLDVDKCFYVYPQKEQKEDEKLFGDLIAEEDRILEADYLRMYPPEAKIIVEAEDNEAVDTKPVREKKPKKKKQKKSKKAADENKESEESTHTGDIDTSSKDKDVSKSGQKAEGTDSVEVSEEERIRRGREDALEQILSKKSDKDRVKESARQLAKAIKDIDTSKTKQQVKSVAESVRDNVKKATDVFGEAVGTKAILNDMVLNSGGNDSGLEEQIVDGIIESVLEPPKKVVGQVVTNEELDALLPDSLEAMSVKEIADIEARKAERLKSEEDKQQTGPSPEEKSSFAKLKAKFLEGTGDEEEEKPLDSLGFITVVQADVDKTMEEDIPHIAGMLHQMIDNKEFYSGEDSMSFETESSYKNHGFEVENYDFDTYLEEENVLSQTEAEVVSKENELNIPTVEIIYAQKKIVDFDEIIPKEVEKKTIENPISEKEIEDSQMKESKQSDETFNEVGSEHEEERCNRDRESLRAKILLSDSMTRKLSDLKESR